MVKRFEVEDKVRVKGGKGWGRTYGEIKEYKPKTKIYHVCWKKGLPTKKVTYIGVHGVKRTYVQKPSGCGYFSASELVKQKRKEGNKMGKKCGELRKQLIREIGLRREFMGIGNFRAVEFSDKKINKLTKTVLICMGRKKRRNKPWEA